MARYSQRDSHFVCRENGSFFIVVHATHRQTMIIDLNRVFNPCFLLTFQMKYRRRSNEIEFSVPQAQKLTI